MNKRKILLVLIMSIFLGVSVVANAGLFNFGKKKKKAETGKASELSVFMVSDARPFNPDWAMFKLAEEKTNVQLTGYTKSTDGNQAFSLMVASGDLADIISKEIIELERLGVQGGMLALNDLIDEHAPNIKKFFDENPRFRKDAVALNGNIYALPAYYDWYNSRVARTLFIRKDWLKKAGLDVPKTMEELETALREFKTFGNEVVPLFMRGRDEILSQLLGLFGAHEEFYIDGDILKYGPMQDEFKEAVKIANRWYKDGLIDAEIFTRGFGARDALLPSNRGGATVDWPGSTSNYNKLSNEIPGFDIAPIAPVKLDSGKKSIVYSRNTTKGFSWGISSACKDPVAAIKFMDWFFSEEGRRAFNFGIEGVHYTMENGKPQFTDVVLNDPNGKTPIKVLWEAGSMIMHMGVQQDYEYEKQWYSDYANLAVDLYMAEEDNTYPPLPILKMSDSDLKEYGKIKQNCLQYVRETAQKWIMDSTDNIDVEFEAFRKRLKELKIERADEIANKAYNTFNNN